MQEIAKLYVDYRVRLTLKYHKCSGMRMEKVFLYIGNNHVGKEKKHRNDSLGEDKQ